MQLEAFRNEYANAQLECNAADERSKLLASEVIGLEEKVVILLGMLAYRIAYKNNFSILFWFYWVGETFFLCLKKVVYGYDKL